LAQAAVAALAALLVVVAARRRGIHLEKELMIAMVRGLVQIVAVGSILLLLLHAPDWTSVLLLASMIVAAGATSARRAKGMPEAFRVSTYSIACGAEADQQSHFPISQAVNDTIALYSSPMRRLADLGADALTEIDALSSLLDASDSTLAGDLLAEYGSLTGLARASLANLRRFLPQTKAARLVAALRLGTLACKDPLTQEHFDNPESVYNAFGPEMRVPLCLIVRMKKWLSRRCRMISATMHCKTSTERVSPKIVSMGGSP
jgi:hypothetical protein